jgi:hypothetical protein
MTTAPVGSPRSRWEAKRRLDRTRDGLFAYSPVRVVET